MCTYLAMELAKKSKLHLNYHSTAIKYGSEFTKFLQIMTDRSVIKAKSNLSTHYTEIK